MMDNGKIVGGAIIEINEETQHNALDLLFISVFNQNEGIGQKIWNEIKKLYSNTKYGKHAHHTLIKEISIFM